MSRAAVRLASWPDDEDTQVDAVVHIVDDVPPRPLRARAATRPMGSRCSRVVARVGG